MCTGAEAAALALSAAGTAAGVDAQQQAESDRRRAIAQGLQAEADNQQKSNTTTDEYVKETYDPTTRMQRYESTASDGERALGDLLAKQSSLGQGEITAATSGAVSDAYRQARAAAGTTAANRSRNQARLLSRAGGVGNLMGNEALAGADYASDMLGHAVNSRLNQNLTNARYGAAGGGNLALLGGLLSGAGQAVGGMAGRNQPTSPNALGYGVGYTIPTASP